MLCPLIAVGLLCNNNTIKFATTHSDCVQKNCAWYLPQLQCCAIAFKVVEPVQYPDVSVTGFASVFNAQDIEDAIIDKAEEKNT